MKISDKLGSTRSLMEINARIPRTFPKNKPSASEKFNASDIALILHCIVQINPSFL